MKMWRWFDERRMVLRGTRWLHESFEKGHGRLETRRVDR